MKHLHLFKNTNAKFSDPYIEFINKNFNPQEHLFLIIGKRTESQSIQHDNVKILSKILFGIILLNKYMYKSEKIFLHGLFIPSIVTLLFMQPWLLKKCHWVVWGGDLYHFEVRKRSFKSNLYELIRKYVIKNMGALITHVKGDYNLAKSWYGVKGRYLYSFMYPSNLYHDIELSRVLKDSKKKYILVGNSASPTNYHIDVFHQLEEYKNEEIEIICPLSYGDVEYRKKVIKEGTRIFGDKFVAIIDFIPFEQYLELIAKVDIGVFNHKRQQAIGNITNLLGLGKKVYIREDITTWEFAKRHELSVFSINTLRSTLFISASDIQLANNISKVKTFFSEVKLKEDLTAIFND